MKTSCFYVCSSSILLVRRFQQSAETARASGALFSFLRFLCFYHDKTGEFLQWISVPSICKNVAAKEEPPLHNAPLEHCCACSGTADHSRANRKVLRTLRDAAGTPGLSLFSVMQYFI
jgi:hypothetical protein